MRSAEGAEVVSARSGGGEENRARRSGACLHGLNLPIYNYLFGTKTPTNGDCTGGRCAVPLQCPIEMNWILGRTVNVILFGASRATTPYADAKNPDTAMSGFLFGDMVGQGTKKSGRVCACPESLTENNY